MNTAGEFEVVLRDKTGATIRFCAPRGRSLVKSAAQAGIDLTTGCLQGRCAICRSHIVDGEVELLRRQSTNVVGSPLHRDDGCVLICSVGPVSNLTIEPLGPWRCKPAASEISGDVS